MRKKGTYYAVRYLKAALIILFLLSVAGYFGAANRYFELSSHFKVQYLYLSFLLLLLAAFLKLRYWSILALILLSLNSYAVLPIYFSRSSGDGVKFESHLSLIQSNVNTSTIDHSKLIALIYREKPDIVILQEVNSGWAKSLMVLSEILPYKNEFPRTDNFGIAIYSRWPLKDVKVIPLGNFGVPSISAKLMVSGKTLNIFTMHAYPPINHEYFIERNKQLAEAALFLRNVNPPIIFLGDLNLTMWSPFYRILKEETGLVSCRNGYRILPTWPVNMPLVMIPIDHCLTSGEVRIEDINTGDPIGSDHLPLIVKISL